MMRVLYIGGFELPDKNAAAHRVISIAKCLRERGDEVVFYGITNCDDCCGVFDDFRYEAFSHPGRAIAVIKYAIGYKITKVIDKYSPHIVIAYNYPAIALNRVLRYCHKRMIKVYGDITEWYDPSSLIKKLEVHLRMKYTYFRLDGIIAISRFLFDYFHPKVRTIQIPPLVDLSLDKWKRSRVLCVNEDLVLVYAGNPGTGSKDRLDVLVSTVANRPGIKLKVIGINKEQYESIWGPIAHGVNNVFFMGRVSHLQAISEVCNSDFQMLIRSATRVNMAGFPTKFVESICCGTPVIANPTSNLEDYLISGFNGFIVNSYSELDSLLSRIRLMDSSSIIEMKQNCIQMSQFDYHSFVSELNDFLS